MLLFSLIRTRAELTAGLEQITDIDELNHLREVVLSYNRKGYDHPLKHSQYGFASTFKAMDKRAAELGCIKYSFGYRKPL